MRSRRNIIPTVILWITVLAGLQLGAVAGGGAISTALVGANHWAFQPIQPVAPPADPRVGMVPVVHPIDRFIHVRLATNRLTPASLADRRTLVRRATFDLLGLPPTPAEVDAFVADEEPDAFGRLVDRLLASPHYGERWGRWWLDLARYADTNGQDENKVMANAWRYRDWVIRAFNADLPFDQFATDQLAGDLLPTNGVPERMILDRWTATGLLVLGPKMLAEQDKPKLVMDIVDEQIDVVSRAFLGLTIACARCHDHKFDPIPARDYYALAGIFKSTRTMENLSFVSKFHERRIATREELSAIEASQRAIAEKTDAIAAAIRRANQSLQAARNQQWVQWLASPGVALAGAGAGAFGESGTNVLVRLSALWAADPATNSLSRTLRDLAAAPGLAQDFLHGSGFPTNRAVRLAPGRVGAAFHASGSNYLERLHADTLEPAQLTVETWVRSEDFPAGGDARRWLIDKNGNEWTEGHYALMLDRNRAGAYLNIGGGRENVFAVWSDGPALKTNQWHHLAFTYDGSVLALFVDGAAAGSTSIQRPRLPGTSSLVLGRRQDGYVSFRGRLDEARVYDRVLPSAELKAHFERPDQPVAAGVVARWEFNDLSEVEQRALAWDELRGALFGPGGILALPADPQSQYPPETRQAIALLEAERDQLKAVAPPPAGYALAVAEDPPVDLPIHIRGSHLNLAREPVPRGFMHALHPGVWPALPSGQSGRLELARWLTSPENPLTARVVVNRIWQAHFGEGLVRTSDNFGLRGDRPTHPELLDWLAREFQREGWSVKALHRRILTSATWQQESIGPAAVADMDPDNRLLAHFPRQRLDAEMIRDALLAVSGRLDTTPGGTLVQWKNDEYVPRTEEAALSVRRSVYLPIVRDGVYDVFSIFDFANPSVGVAKRTPTVVSHQALFFLNSPLVKSSARALAEMLLALPAADENARIHLAYRYTLNRPPSVTEMARAARFLQQTGVKSEVRGEIPALVPWASLCQTLFAANEFIYRD